MNKSQHYEEVTITVKEDLTDNSTGRLIEIPKATIKVFDYISSRTYGSYCYEFCGYFGIPFKKCCFMLNEKVVTMDRKVLEPCNISVINSCEEVVGTKMQSAMLKLFTNSIYCDLKLLLQDEVFHVHKGILMARSPKFRTMLSSFMKEGYTSSVTILSDCSPSIFKLMLMWIYGGTCKMPLDVFESCKLLALADEYLLNDLVSICEDDILLKINTQNVVRLITQNGMGIPERSDQKIFAECESVLLTNFKSIYESDPDIEKKLVAVPGLITKILLNANNIKHSVKKSKTPKKRVRFDLTKSEITTQAESHSFSDAVEFEPSAFDTQSIHLSFNNNIDVEEETSLTPNDLNE